ncbi:chondroitin sulfate synthase 1-like [Panonychus citri]|uniref:chondroitin sulfate synthase 1-like n=1 Tax=Panonychus citri TaxID=50023 RepID=UPI0023082EBC|nr:chondroitin sulfate synthase 1-like [Panonychus citri]
MRFRFNYLLCSPHGPYKSYLHFLISFIASLTLCLYFQRNEKVTVNQKCDEGKVSSSSSPNHQVNSNLDQSYESLLPLIESLRRPTDDGNKRKLFIGVMTAQKFIDYRINHIMETWGQDAKDFIAFFSSSSSKDNHGLPVINLPTVDDSYPPQKKSFLMLKFIHDHFIDSYEWFMRADDDIFINVDKLIQFLGSVNSSKPHLIGQMGLGKIEELGQLGLGDDDNFCMGGPGIIMSSATLRSMIPHIEYCLKHLYSTHEDVEISRCVGTFVGLPCTRSYQMQSLLYHNFSGQIVWSNRLRKILKTALTLHPVKNSSTLYDIYYHMMQIDHENIRFEITKNHRDLRNVEHNYGDLIERQFNLPLDPLVHGDTNSIGTPIELTPKSKDQCLHRSDLITWDFIDRYQYSVKNSNPRRRIDGSLIPALESNLINIVNTINKGSHFRGRIVDFKSLYYGYTKLDPSKGVYYILDLLMTYRRYKGRKYTLPVRKHTYIMQTFSNPIFKEIKSSSQPLESITVNIIVPLSGRFKQFQRFINNFIRVNKKDSNVNLAFILFPDVIDTRNVSIQMKTIIINLMNSGLPIRFAELGGHFSRAAGLQRGASLFKSNDLLFFVDIDITFNLNAIERVRLNTIQGKQVYYPIVYSQYDNQFDIDFNFDQHSDYHNNDNNIIIDSVHGYWRQFGFGIVSIYNSDLINNNGLNLSIQGWGKEDVDLYERLVQSNLTIFRSPDSGLIHIFHQTDCPNGLHGNQYEMCLGSKYNNLASIETMSKYIYHNKIL